jgi:hypothetical protein
MKPAISMFIALAMLLLVACQSDKKPVTNTTPTAPQLPSAGTPIATAGVQHYICPKNCAGSGSPQAGVCPTCGSQYAHNAAFHNQPANSTSAPNQQLPASPIIVNPQPNATQPVTGETPPAQPAPEPAQNAAGVWHYVCSKGCAGGSGKRGYCDKCGAGLDHNTAYHN